MARFGLLLTIWAFAFAAIPSGISKPMRMSPRQSAQQQQPCAGRAYHEFDFWIGDWDAFDVGKPNAIIARNSVDSILGGCVVREDYRAPDGMEGQSFSIYDATRKIWHQTWVTNRGRLLVIEGNYRNGEMAMSGVDRTMDGKERHIRGVWRPVRDGVRETAATSTDGGKTWKPWFDMIFRKHAE